MSLEGRVIWITGLSEAGKTTLAKALLPLLPGTPVLLDGDDLRQAMGLTGKAYDYDSRRELAMVYARLARLLAKQGLTVVVATIALFHEVHAWNRQHLPGYLEVFLDVPEEVRRARDSKGLYAEEKKGKNKQLAGGGTPAEFPLRPDVHWRYNPDDTVADTAAEILHALNR